MTSRPTAPPSVSADGGAPSPGDPGSRHRRAKNRRYRRNRAGRSHKTVMSWNAEGLRKKIGELQRRLPADKIDVLAVQEGQFPQVAPRLSGYQPPVVVRRARGRVTVDTVDNGSRPRQRSPTDAGGNPQDRRAPPEEEEDEIGPSQGGLASLPGWLQGCPDRGGASAVCPGGRHPTNRSHPEEVIIGHDFFRTLRQLNSHIFCS